jgi:hypothetical protein
VGGAETRATPFIRMVVVVAVTVAVAVVVHLNLMLISFFSSSLEMLFVVRKILINVKKQASLSSLLLVKLIKNVVF